MGSLAGSGRNLVAVDGPDAAGKTTLADRLARALGPNVLRASIDGFHHPRAIRMLRGFDSPRGYYHDSFNHEALEEHLLKPFALGAPTVRTRVFDFGTDSPVDAEPVAVPPDCTLLLDGVFLLRPQLRHWWNLAIYVHVPEHVSVARAVERDLELFGSREAVEARYRERYLPGQALYRDDAKPHSSAHIVLDNSDHDAPVVLKWDAPA